MSELARKDGPGGWAVAATVMSLEGVVEIGTGFGLSGAKRSHRPERAHRRQGSERRRSCPLCTACLGDPGDGRPVHRSSLRAAPLPRPADACHRSEDERAARTLRPRHAPAEPPVPDARGIAFALAGLEEQMAEAGVAIAAARLDAVARLSALIQATREARGPGPFPFAVLGLEGTLERALMERPAVEVEDDYVSLLVRGAGARPARRPGPCRTAFERPNSGSRPPQCARRRLLLGRAEGASARPRARQGEADPRAFRRRPPRPFRRGCRPSRSAPAGRPFLARFWTSKAQAWMTGTDRETFASLASQAQILAVNWGRIGA